MKRQDGRAQDVGRQGAGRHDESPTDVDGHPTEVCGRKSDGRLMEVCGRKSDGRLMEVCGRKSDEC
jgi:hypothetical protein